MSNDDLSPEVRAKICSHMNHDHKEALLGYARFHGGVSTPIEAKMVDINSKFMELLVDGYRLDIHFDRALSNRNDAHKTLIEMAKQSTNNI